MGRKVGSLMLVIAVALGVPAYASQGTISGVVKNASGVPQMGAMVEVFARGTSHVATGFTDTKGFYTLAQLIPGTYDVKVSAPSFLPTLRESVSLRSGANLVVNLTLNTLSDAIRFLPTKQGTSDDDDWKWTLRSAANRPILRVKNGEPLVIANGNDREFRASVAFVAGSDGDAFGGTNEMSTRFNVEHSLFQTGMLSLDGDVGYGPGANGTVLRTSYVHRMPDGSRPEISLTVRRFAMSPTSALQDAALDALSFSASDNFTFGDFVDVRVGSEFQSVQFLGRVNAFRPFGSVGVHLSPDTVMEYQYATSVPNTRRWKGFDTAPADLSESGPRMSLLGTRSLIERGRHQELSLSKRHGNTAVQVAYFHDSMRNSALTGVGDVQQAMEDILPDVYSGTFAYSGGDLNTNGMRVVVERRLSNGITATMNYAFGGVLELDGSNVSIADLRSSLDSQLRHSVAGKVSGTIPRSKTQWLTSYKWTSGNAISTVDLFNSGPGQTDPYLNVFLRQPLPGTNFMPGKLEALVDLRNLLAQGYRPVVGPDGQTLYLVQAARSIRGGLAFVF
ncbi:MAG TPA: carboxypeptidase-like regulatory domain-containing protein [Terriglobales bacterium]|nr:carboxypeptidase-like regulatory domain-containing protein [Terriglobales bacterium]